METEPTPRQSPGGRVFAGLIVILIGVVLLLDRTGLGGIHFSGHYWPVIVIALGVFRLLDPPHHDGRPVSRRSGAWLIYVGSWGLVNELHLFGFDYATSWPLMVIGAGLCIVWRAIEPGQRGCGAIREN